MHHILNAATVAGLVMVLAIIVRARGRLRYTTMLTAWAWCVATLCLWIAAMVATQLVPVASPAVADQLWYATAVISLCPTIAVLGAQRPGVRAWNVFILVPLVCVLGWPALTVWSDGRPQPLRIEVPMLLGYLLVLLMGAGNYIGTRFAGSAMLVIVALCLLVSAQSAAAPAIVAQSSAIPAIASWLLVGAGLSANWQSQRTTVGAANYDRLWADFRDTFGIVWSLRIMERVNFSAEQERWCERLTPAGFVSLSEQAGTRDMLTAHETAARKEHTLRWLLRRFVDPEWITERLHSDGHPQPAELRVTTRSTVQ